jgi:hypothetical protein
MGIGIKKLSINAKKLSINAKKLSINAEKSSICPQKSGINLKSWAYISRISMIILLKTKSDNFAKNQVLLKKYLKNR